MRVAVVIERFGAPGGAESAAQHLVRELARRGVDVTVVCRQAAVAPAGGASLLRLPVSNGWQPVRLRRFSRLAAAATRDRFDVVHGFSRTREQDIYRVGGGCHAAYMERVYRRPRLQRALSPRHRAILSIEEAVLRDPSQLVQCNAHWVAEELRGRYAVPAERLVTIYNGVDTAHFHPGRRDERGAALRQELGAARPLALFAGSGFQRKGLDRALRGLAESGVDAELAVVGAGDASPYRRLAAELGIAKRVHFLGPRRDLADVYAAADLLVLPTRYDAFANVCLEAMASGLAVATTPANGASELIEPGVNGLLFDADFAPAFALLRDPAALRNLGSAARDTARELTWQAHAERVLELYARICA